MPYITKNLQDSKASQSDRLKQWKETVQTASGKKNKPTEKATKKTTNKKRK